MKEIINKLEEFGVSFEFKNWQGNGESVVCVEIGVKITYLLGSYTMTSETEINTYSKSEFYLLRRHLNEILTKKTA